MIAHIVLFEPRPDLSEEERQALIAAVRAAAGEIPAIRRMRVGRRVRLGVPGYEQVMADDYAYAAVVEFETLDALRSYLAHPGHARLGQHFAKSSARALAYDYHLVDGTDAADLLNVDLTA